MSKSPRMIMTLLIGFVIFIGLPVLAWGIGDRSEFCDHPARMAYIVLTVVMQSVVVTVMPNAGRDRRKETVPAAASPDDHYFPCRRCPGFLGLD